MKNEMYQFSTDPKYVLIMLNFAAHIGKPPYRVFSVSAAVTYLQPDYRLQICGLQL